MREQTMMMTEYVTQRKANCRRFSKTWSSNFVNKIIRATLPAHLTTLVEKSAIVRAVTRERDFRSTSPGKFYCYGVKQIEINIHCWRYVIRIYHISISLTWKWASQNCKKKRAATRYLLFQKLSQSEHADIHTVFLKSMGGGGWAGAERGWVISFWALRKGWVIRFSATRGGWVILI